MINPMDLSGKLILVTGASSGLGRQTCITLSQLGAKVILLARNEEKLSETLSLMEGDNHEYYSYDLTDLAGIEGLVTELVEKNGKFDGFVHCAGRGDMAPVMATTYRFMHDMLKIHLYAFTEIVRVITKKKNFNQKGSIVAISSTATSKADKGKTAYITAKGALDTIILPLAVELGESKKIRVNTVNPGWAKTDMYYKFIELYGQDKMDEMLSSHILGIAEPEEIANVIAFLLSDAATQITGQSINVDGGFSIN